VPHTSKPPWWDIEVSTLSRMLEIGAWEAHEISAIQRQIDDRKDQIMGGLGSAAQIRWTKRVQLELDPECRVRRDPVHGWMLDRWVEDFQCWHPVGYIGSGGRVELRNIGDHHGMQVDMAIVVDDKVRPDLIAFLRSRDMQRPGYHQEKRKKSAKIRADNEQAATDKVKAAIESLSTAQIKQFIEVERAIQTGETVTMHGSDMAAIERMTKAGRHAPAGPMSDTPGLHPNRIQRNYKELGEGEEYVRNSEILKSMRNGGGNGA